MGFLDFLKKNRPVPDAAPAPVAPPAEPSFGNAVFSGAPASSDAFLDHLTEEHDPADDLFSPNPASIPPLAKTPEAPKNQTYGLPDDLFAPPKDEHRDAPSAPTPTSWTAPPVAASTAPPAPTTAPSAPVSQPMPARGAATEIPDFSAEDIAAIEALEMMGAQSALAPVTPIGMDLPAVAATPQKSDSISEYLAPPKSSAPSLPSLPQAPIVAVTRTPPAEAAPVPQAEDGFLSATDYVLITDGIRASRRSLRKCDDGIKDALGRHEATDAQYARAAADIASVEQRLRTLDTSLFGE